MTASPKWQDLAPRVISAVVLIAVGAVEIWFGGWLFLLTVCAVCGVMIWEAARMFDAERPRMDGVIAAITLLFVMLMPPFLLVPMVVASALVAAVRAGRDKRLFFLCYIWILIACFAVILLRDFGDFPWFLWAIFVVAASDIGGYFAGRMFGGPKFWPTVSPKKTWSGTVAGWMAASLVGAVMVPYLGVGQELIFASVLVAFAAQMGDIGESAVKRRAGVKDSSSLIPGHGG
ncbi:MAG: phosphatidate cytidylyltransferase, partial [Pseudomonadota bacterium]